MKDKKLDLNKVEYMWFWENDYRKSNLIFYGLKDDPVGVEEDYITRKTTDLTKLIREKGVRFYTCDDDFEDGDDYRYGYYYNLVNKEAIDFQPLDQMEGDGHVHMFYKKDGEYKQVWN